MHGHTCHCCSDCTCKRLEWASIRTFRLPPPPRPTLKGFKMKYVLDADTGVFLELELKDSRNNVKTLDQIPNEQITVTSGNEAVFTASQDGPDQPIKVLPVGLGTAQLTVAFQESPEAPTITAAMDIEVVAGKITSVGFTPVGTFPLEPPPG